MTGEDGRRQVHPATWSQWRKDQFKAVVPPCVPGLALQHGSLLAVAFVTMYTGGASAFSRPGQVDA